MTNAPQTTPPKRDHRLRNTLITVAFGILLYAVIMNLGKVKDGIRLFVTFTKPVIVGLAAAYVMNVLMSALENKVFFFMNRSRHNWIKKLVRPISLILTLIIVFGIVTLLIFAALPSLQTAFLELFQKIPGYLESFRDWLVKLIHSIDLVELDTEWLEGLTFEWSTAVKLVQDIDWDIVMGWFGLSSSALIGGTASTAATAVTGAVNVVSGIVQFVFSLIIALYFLAQKEKIGAFCHRFITAFLPEKAANKVFHIAEVANKDFNGFIRAQCTEAVVFGLLCFIMLTICRYKYAGICCLVIGITTLVPIIGPTIGLTFGVLLQLTVSPIRAVLLVVIILGMQQVDDNLIYPKIVGKAIGLPGILVISGVLVGSSIGGIIGALCGVPLCAVFYDLLRESIATRNAKKEAEKAQQEQSAPTPENTDPPAPSETPTQADEGNAP